MSDPYLSIQRQIQETQDSLERLRKADAGAIYLPWAQRSLNSFPLASSATSWGETAQPWEVYCLAWYVSVFVVTTNNGTNFWTLTLRDEASSVLATLSTSAIAANTWTRLSTTAITQPSAANTIMTLRPTATLSPGAIFIVPALALLKTGT
jgi:hypothetical protein